MAKIQFKIGDAYLKKLSSLESKLRREVCGAAIYGAAGIVADAIAQQISELPTDERWGTPEHPASGPRKVEAQAIASGLGIAPLQDDGTGYLNVKIGFDGYSKLRTKRWPNGQPIQMLARSVERGTSFMKPNPFVKRAVSSSRKRAIDYMKKKVDEATKESMKG